jgi:aspartate kinase
VLNAQAVQFAKAKGIAIYALQTPHDGEARTGTVVRKDAPPPVGGVRGVAHRAPLHRLIGRRSDALPAMLAFLDLHHLPSGQIVALDDKVEILVPPEDAHGFATACAGLAPDALFGRGDDVGAVSLVGQGILEDRRVIAAALALLHERAIAVLGASTSSFRVTFLVPAGAAAEQAARLLHGRFVASERVETPSAPSVL